MGFLTDPMPTESRPIVPEHTSDSEVEEKKWSFTPYIQILHWSRTVSEKTAPVDRMLSLGANP